MKETDLMGWVQMNSLFEQENRNGTFPSCREPDAYPWVGWRMCVGWLSLCRTQWVRIWSVKQMDFAMVWRS